MTAKEIMQIPNQEQKSIGMRTYGWDKLLEGSDAKVIATETVLTAARDLEMFNEQKREYELVTIPSQEVTYQVIEVDLGDDDGIPARFVKVQCWSTFKEALLRVDPRNDATKDPIGAIASTFNMTREEYVLENET